MRHALLVTLVACGRSQTTDPAAPQAPTALPSEPCTFPLDTIVMYTGQSINRPDSKPFLDVETIELNSNGVIYYDLTQYHTATIWSTHAMIPDEPDGHRLDTTQVQVFDVVTRVIETSTGRELHVDQGHTTTWWPRDRLSHNVAASWLLGFPDLGFEGLDACTTPVDLHFRMVLRQNPNCVWERTFTNLQPRYLGEGACPIWVFPGQEPRDTVTSEFDPPP
jgi:hypothetical protein